MPERIQLRRTKGWRKPPGCIVVSRPSRWGNPYRVGDLGVSDRATATARFRRLLARPDDELAADHTLFMFSAARLAELAGHDLACWCPLDQPCHADVLLEIANP